MSQTGWLLCGYKAFFNLIAFSFPSPFLCRGHRLGPGDDEMYQRTTVSIMQKEPGSGALINSYSSQGFLIDGNKVLGPCAVLPPAILQWNVSPTVFSPVYWLVQIKHFNVFLGLHLCFSMSAGWQPCRHHRGECLTFPYD